MRLHCQGTSGNANSAYAFFDLAAVTASAVTVVGAWDNTAARIEALAEKFGRPVDLVDLYPAPEPLLGQVLRHGRQQAGQRMKMMVQRRVAPQRRGQIDGHPHWQPRGGVLVGQNGVAQVDAGTQGTGRGKVSGQGVQWQR